MTPPLKWAQNIVLVTCVEFHLYHLVYTLTSPLGGMLCCDNTCPLHLPLHHVVQLYDVCRVQCNDLESDCLGGNLNRVPKQLKRKRIYMCEQRVKRLNDERGLLRFYRLRKLCSNIIYNVIYCLMHRCVVLEIIVTMSSFSLN